MISATFVSLPLLSVIVFKNAVDCTKKQQLLNCDSGQHNAKKHFKSSEISRLL
jgi:hypothetical protein